LYPNSNFYFIFVDTVNRLIVDQLQHYNIKYEFHQSDMVNYLKNNYDYVYDNVDYVMMIHSSYYIGIDSLEAMLYSFDHITFIIVYHDTSMFFADGKDNYKFKANILNKTGIGNLGKVKGIFF